jgi:two-component system OmpR family response regulator
MVPAVGIRTYVTATILIVDDSTFIVEGLVALLRKSYRALPSFGGEECLDILRTEQPDVIVLDIMMEPMDGWETLARIKDNPATRHIPVLMFSAKKISPDEAEAHRIRIDDFLTKPVNPRELVAALEKILEREKRKKKILYQWAKAGTPQEKTDEFLTLSSNRDVDISLISAMKKQMDHPTTLPVRREELASSILVLEDRIEKGRTRIEEFFRETGLTLPSPSDDTEPDAPTPTDAPADSMPVPANDTGTLPSPSDDTEPDAPTPADVPADSIPVPANAPGTLTPLQPAIEDSLPGETAGHEAGETGAGAAGELSDGPGSIITGPDPNQVPSPVGVMSVQGDESSDRDEPVAPSLSPEPGHESSAGLQCDDTPLSVSLPPEPVGMTTPVTDHIEWIHLPPPAGPGEAGKSPGIEHLFEPEPDPAALKEKESRAQGPDTPVYKDPEGQIKPLPSAHPQRGFLSGIIAAIAGFFGRGKP